MIGQSICSYKTYSQTIIDSEHSVILSIEAATTAKSYPLLPALILFSLPILAG